ncbi:MAG: hypothetical protein J6W75_03370 [Bacteroidaceae bacterium]|nr:hypothetical protein [Bacteroidaceae bacterium]
MKRLSIFGIVLMFTFSTVSASGLVLTMKNGQRMAFTLSKTENVLMTQADDAVVLNGHTFAKDDIQELRIFRELPDDAILLGITSPEAVQPLISSAVYDLSGRKVADSLMQLKDGVHRSLPQGIYIVNNQKIVIR